MKENIQEIVLDWLSVGLDPEKSHFFIQSMIPEIAELTIYFSMMVTVARLQRNPTVKEELENAKMTQKEITYGFLGYPVSQAADILIVRSNIVPVGEDQLPHLEQTREIARRFNQLFGETFPIPNPLLSDFSRLPGIDGKKMSKSQNNAIYLKDDPETIKNKVKRAYTDPTRLRATDPGHIEGNVVFAYLEAFAPDKEELQELKRLYQAGKIGDVPLKQRLTEILVKFLEPIQERRREYVSKPKFVNESLHAGILKTREEAEKTIDAVREALHFDYNYSQIFP